MIAQTKRMHAEIIAAVDRWDANDEVRAVIFAAAGKAYGAGTDFTRTEMTGKSGGDNEFDPLVVEGVESDATAAG